MNNQHQQKEDQMGEQNSNHGDSSTRQKEKN
jgi:hypothetical protein